MGRRVRSKNKRAGGSRCWPRQKGNMSKGRQPDWTLCQRHGDDWETVGAGWNSEKGISLVLNEETKGHVMAFHYRPREKRRPTRTRDPYFWKRAGSLPHAQTVAERLQAEKSAPVAMDPDPEAPEWL